MVAGNSLARPYGRFTRRPSDDATNVGSATRSIAEAALLARASKRKSGESEKEQTCRGCGQVGTNFTQCVKKGCNFGVFYCSLQCQTSDWVNHKHICPGAKTEDEPAKVEVKRKPKPSITAEEATAQIRRMLMCLNCGNPRCRFAREFESGELITTLEAIGGPGFVTDDVLKEIETRGQKATVTLRRQN